MCFCKGSHDVCVLSSSTCLCATPDPSVSSVLHQWRRYFAIIARLTARVTCPSPFPLQKTAGLARLCHSYYWSRHRDLTRPWCLWTLTYTTPLHATTLHHTLHAPHGMSAHLIRLFRNVPLRVSHAHITESIPCRRSSVHVPSVNSQPWRFTNNSLGPPQPIPCLFACFYESVLCVYAFFSTCLCTCVAIAAWFVFGFVFITTFMFSFIFLCEFNTFLMTVLLLYAWPCSYVCPPFLSACFFIILIPAYVYLNIHTHFPPLPFSYTFIAIFIYNVCSMYYIYIYGFVCFLLFPKLNTHLCYGVYWCNHIPTHILILWFLVYFHFSTCTSTKIRSSATLVLQTINSTMTYMCEYIETK